ncbi:MAG: hypothetical protein H6978_14720 [Gammaproteobacteria bacterium]|nr:hypothetical protein [Gammaproteobacteria bacterium]
MTTDTRPSTTPEIIFVKKVLADGNPCRKCQDVEQRLQRGGWDRLISRVVVAEEANPDSEGMRIAREHGVDRAPFFVVHRADGQPEIHTIFLRLVREVLEPLGQDIPADSIAA